MPLASTSSFNAGVTSQFPVGNGYQQPGVPLQAESNHRNHFDILLQASGQHPQQQNFAPGGLAGEPAFFYPDNNLMSSFASGPGFFDNQIPQVTGSLPQSPDAVLLEILYPGWPRDLPTPTLTTRLIEVYFAKSHMASGELYRPDHASN